MSRPLLTVALFWSVVLAVLSATIASAETVWTDADTLTVEGRAFPERAATWDRLPAAAEGVVRQPVWDLSRDSAGIAIRFVTDSTAVAARWKLRKSKLEMPHMPATGVSGVDLYIRTDDGWRWVNCGQATAVENTVTLVRGLPAAPHEFMLYLPLYNGVETIEIGTLSGSSIEPAPARTDKPIVFYGTSITHGACASRPGMCHPAILGRRLDRPIVNLGFSGNGRLEPEVARFLVEIDAAVFVLDCLPNLNPQQVAERTEPLVRQIREAHPNVPIVLVEDRAYANNPFDAGRRDRNAGNWAAFRAAYDRLVADGVRRLFYLEGADLLGEDGEGTVDGSHPNDLGFMRQADAFEPVLRQALRRSPR
jgi:lysophospholipase L1-like esterase